MSRTKYALAVLIGVTVPACRDYSFGDPVEARDDRRDAAAGAATETVFAAFDGGRGEPVWSAESGSPSRGEQLAPKTDSDASTTTGAALTASEGEGSDGGASEASGRGFEGGTQDPDPSGSEEIFCPALDDDAGIEAECTPETEEPCGECGKRRCRADCRWGFCEAAGGARNCGACGTQRCMARGYYSACQPTAASQPCGICGVKYCSTGGQWGFCEGTGKTQACGQCGTQTCVTGGVWSSCEGSGRTQGCGSCGVQSCDSFGRWGVCEGTGVTRACFLDGTQTCGTGGNWSVCM